MLHRRPMPGLAGLLLPASQPRPAARIPGTNPSVTRMDPAQAALTASRLRVSHRPRQYGCEEAS
jgi:hypothetical protein